MNIVIFADKDRYIALVAAVMHAEDTCDIQVSVKQGVNQYETYLLPFNVNILYSSDNAAEGDFLFFVNALVHKVFS
jgi:hypothetical protein